MKRFFSWIVKDPFKIFIAVVAIFSIVSIVHATAPNPGHNFTEIGGGAVQGDILYGSAADTISALAKDTNATRYLSNTGTTNNPAWAQVNLANGVTGNLPVGNLNSGTGAAATTFWQGDGTWSSVNLASSDVTGITPIANGGTNASLTLANGGVIYSTASAFGVSAAGSSGQILQSAGAASPVWTTATYPATAGTSGNFLVSDGTNFVSTAPASIKTVVTRPVMATGATLTTQTFTTVLTARKAGLFNVPAQITVNQLTFQATVGGTTPSYTMKVCVYNEAGTSKLIDVTSGTISATSVQSVTVGSVILPPGNYYVVYGPATQSGTSPTIALTNFTSTAATWVNTSAVPAGKRIYEGTLTSASGVCDSSMGTITGVVSSTPVMRLDN